MTSDQHDVCVQPGEGSSYWVLGDLYTFKVVGEQTNQHYTLLELTVRPQGGTPPHIHHHEDEACYVQEGTFEFQVGDKLITATPGTFVHSPRGQVHRFVNLGSTPGKILCWATPAGVEKFFAEIGIPVSDLGVSPSSLTKADMERVMTTAAKYGIELVQPADC